MSPLAGKSANMKIGPWTDDEDQRLAAYIQSHDVDKSSWLSVPEAAGISRSSQSCRLRWYSHLKKAIKRGNFTHLETDKSEKLHRILGNNRLVAIGATLPERTKNKIKNYWKHNSKKTNNPSTHQEMSTGSISGEKVHEFWKSPDGFTSNDDCSSDVSEIRSELSSNAGDIWTDDLTFEPNDDFGSEQYMWKDLFSDVVMFESNFDFRPDHHRDLLSGDLENEEDNLLWISNFIAEETRGQSNNAISRTTSNDDVGQSTIVIAPPVGGRQVEYSYGTDTTLNDTDDNDEQSNGEIFLSLEVIKQHFHMNMDDAVESLKVSRSTLKRICRKYGIKRWPYRKRRKVDHKRHSHETNLTKSINAPGYRSNIDTSSSNMNIKATYKDDIIKFRLPVSSGLDDLMEQVAKRLKLEIQTFKLKYMDDDCELVLIACDEDLRDSLSSRQVEYNQRLDIFVFELAITPSVPI